MLARAPSTQTLCSHVTCHMWLLFCAPQASSMSLSQLCQELQPRNRLQFKTHLGAQAWELR